MVVISDFRYRINILFHNHTYLTTISYLPAFLQRKENSLLSILCRVIIPKIKMSITVLQRFIVISIASKDKIRCFKICWKEEIQSFSQTYETLYLDSSLLLMEPYGFLQADDIRYHKTVKAVKKLYFIKV